MRTRALLDALPAAKTGQLRYVAPDGSLEALGGFLASRSRALLVTGPPGCGKTRLTYHLAAHCGNADWQIHSVESWDPQRPELATDMLRYASLPPGHDAMLTLETACGGLARPCVVVIDGINSQDRLYAVARQVDLALRQVTAGNLRFVLVVRTPPEPELAAYPLLAASIYQPPPARGSSYRLASWRSWAGPAGVGRATSSVGSRLRRPAAADPAAGAGSALHDAAAHRRPRACAYRRHPVLAR